MTNPHQTHVATVVRPPTGAPPSKDASPPQGAEGWRRRKTRADTPPLLSAKDTAERCQDWLAHQAEACRLSLEWGQVEARLQAEHGWYRMAEADRDRHPGQAELDAIQARLEELDLARDELLPTLAGLPATTPETVALKLAVVAELVDVADFPDAHALIVRAREEMLAL